MRERVSGGLALALEHVDAQIERGAAGEGGAFGGAVLAEAAGKMRIEPFRIIAGDPGRRIVEAGRREPRALGGGERARGMAAVLGETPDRRSVELALEGKHAERDRARGGVVHYEG